MWGILPNKWRLGIAGKPPPYGKPPPLKDNSMISLSCKALTTTSPYMMVGTVREEGNRHENGPTIQFGKL